MRKAALYFSTTVARHGGYVYFTSLDLKHRWGEGEATQDQIWVQPPGTPSVGLAYLAAWEATQDPFYLDVVAQVAQALVHGQLRSGGWTNCIDFAADGRLVNQYRGQPRRGKNNSSLDDGQTQTAISFLVQADRAFRFQNVEVHQAAQVALDSLLAAQFPNGGFPQVWTGPVEPHPPKPASFPDYDWRTAGRVKDYWNLPTLNDNVAVHVAQALTDAYAVYGDAKYRQALAELGDFLLLAQMPEPQPAWAQQYNHAMQPVWARKFEPPAIAGHESMATINLLMDIYETTADGKYLAPIPSALAYLRRSELPDGQIARYYELQTNRPLFMRRSGDSYILTYDDGELPAHYSWKTPSQVERLSQRFQLVRQGRSSADSEVALELQHGISAVRQILRDLDSSGRWVFTATGERLVGQNRFPPGERLLSSELFSTNLITLARFVQAVP